MEFRRGRYSWLMRPILTIFDLAVINIFAYYYLNLGEEEAYFFKSKILNNKYVIYFIYSSVLWVFSTYYTQFYNVYRFTSLVKVFAILVKQFFVYIVIVFSFVGIYRSVNLPAPITFKYIFITFSIISTGKILSYFGLRIFRYYFRGNVRNIILIGCGKGIQEFKSIIAEKKELGYIIKEIFCDTQFGTKPLKDCFKYLKDGSDVDEVFCAIDELTEKQVNELIKYASINHSNIKFIPNNIENSTNRFKADFYGVLPVLSIQKVALNNDVNRVIKRSFDIIFSLFVIFFILSWLTPILFVLVKIESKGPLFHKQDRTGIDYKVFQCFKFRSLKTNGNNDNQSYVKQSDERVTKIGKFMRKTSMDELPQFFNVFMGEMSVVGPRPHMLSYTDIYSKKVDKYNFIQRHNVKPGITGLAQISGYRGQIETDQDIIGRVKYDVFYIENWSLLLDIKIIIKTIINILKGEEKAY
ncbi:MAG: exopolysaccharide biosynthesis polyprenyl glycosylphosphotransferase [Flavobacteriaceae bacterium]